MAALQDETEATKEMLEKGELLQVASLDKIVQDQLQSVASHWLCFCGWTRTGQTGFHCRHNCVE